MQRLIILFATILVWTGQQITASKINRKQQEYPRIRNVHFDENKGSRVLTAGQAQCNLEQAKILDITINLNLVGNPHLLTSEEISTVGTLILETYNNLNSCQNPYLRRIQTVDLLTNLQSFQNEGEQVFSLEYVARLSCQGCSENSLLLFYDMDSTESQCPCLAPSEIVFHNSLAEEIEILIEDQEIVHITEFWDARERKQLSQCPPLQDFHASSVVEFYGCPLDLDQSRLETMAASFLATYNQINHRSAGHCDTSFREITSVTPFFDESSSDLRRGLAKTGQKTRDGKKMKSLLDIQKSPQTKHSRALVEDYYHEDLGNESTDYYNNEEFEEPYYNHEQLEETQDYDRTRSFGCDPDYFEIRFDITARCRGCDTNTIRLFDRFQDENFFDGFDDDEANNDDHEDFWFMRRNTREKMEISHTSRQLVEGDCSCPVDPLFRGITEEEMIEVYAVALELIVGCELDIEDVIEIERVECAPQVDSFTSTVGMSIASNSENGIDQKDLDALVLNFQRSYNDLAQRFCDSNFRSVQQVVVSNQTVTPVTRYRELELIETAGTRHLAPTFSFKFMLSFHFFIIGRCRGCPNRFFLFNDATRRSLAKQEMQEQVESTMAVVSDNKYRRLQTDDQCYCATVNFGPGAPTERDFSERYDTDIQTLFNKGNLGSQYTVLSLQENEDDALQELSPLTPEECVVDNDCANGLTLTRLCVNNHCLNEGDPRITLTWEGDDDLDLSVYTPQGARVWYKDDFDPISGGSFDTGFVQNVWGSHVESIFFPASGRAPGGNYEIEVHLYEEREESDTWTLQVFEGGNTQPVLTEVGKGHRSSIIYSRARL